MGSSNLKKLQMIALLGLVTFVALGYVVVQRGVKDLIHFSIGTFRAVGPMTKQTRSVAAFDRIQAGHVYDVDVTYGAVPMLVIEAPSDLMPHLTSSVNNGTLSLGANTGFNLSGNQRVKAHVVTKRLVGANVSGASRLVINGVTKDASFDAHLSGASTLRMSADVDTFEIQASGAAKTTLTGLTAKNLTVNASGASNCSINGKALESKIELSGASHLEGQFQSNRADVEASGASQASLRVRDSLTGEASGASTITYSGLPAHVDTHVSGVSKVNRAG